MDVKTIPISAYFEERLLEKLKSVAAHDDRSVSYVIVQAVREFIGKPENVAKWSKNYGSQVGHVKEQAGISKRTRAAKGVKSM